MYHCHVEATEHMQMGMLGNLYVRPARTERRLGTCNGGSPCTQYAYNDGDGSTGYDVEVPLQLGSFDPDFHDASWIVQPLPFADDVGPLPDDQRPRLPGHRRPEPAAGARRERRHRVAARRSSLITATAGERILLRLSNLNITDVHTLIEPEHPDGGGGHRRQAAASARPARSCTTPPTR